jgi:hypothetical protein
VRWWGSFETAIHDVDENSFEVAPYVNRSDAHRFDSLRLQPGIAAHIAVRIVAEIVGNTVYFNCQSCCLAEEIQHKWFERMLPSELKAARAKPQHSPESNLRRAHASAELTGLVNGQKEPLHHASQ